MSEMNSSACKACALQLHIHLLTCNKACNSPHAGFCFLFRTQNSPGEHNREHCYLKRMCQNGVIIGISAVGGYKQKLSSLAPITPNTPTQTCTNTKQMNHHCGGMSLSLSVSASLPFSALNSSCYQPFFLPPFIFTTYIFVFTQNKLYLPERPS